MEQTRKYTNNRKQYPMYWNTAYQVESTKFYEATMEEG